METIVTYDKVKILDVQRISDAYITYANVMHTDKIYAICGLDKDYGEEIDYIRHLERNKEIFKVGLIDLRKEHNLTFSNREMEEFVETIKKKLVGKVIELKKEGKVKIEYENTYVGYVSGNYSSRLRKRVSKKMINEIRREILGTHKVPNLEEGLKLLGFNEIASFNPVKEMIKFF